MKFFQATEWRPKVAHGETVGLIAKPNPAPERGERNLMGVSVHIDMDRVCRDAGKSGGVPPQSKTLRATRKSRSDAQRLGVRQSSGALFREPSARLAQTVLCV